MTALPLAAGRQGQLPSWAVLAVLYAMCGEGVGHGDIVDRPPECPVDCSRVDDPFVRVAWKVGEEGAILQHGQVDGGPDEENQGGGSGYNR